ncbi:uncharacterized protein YndB with AHSA1/START domain [Herbihabitans rhizosphaerae]|uniref:Uncharacterized protein YndB with AHSA1/START domain n=1 Tax=Herbihabitans rhizosphaerae TaxID=1872711 RepID=A0A4Q7KLM7_9PSEU|nr:SRPBCC family protein [Herbihabitans rhizosphaerae]RZS37167.1 uncharacterized protein YndB with AHSA1/START domain [Herbihabitans rhizosphaerae]
MTDQTYLYTLYIESTREKVWDALINPEFTRQYWNGRIVDSEWRLGAAVTVRHDYDDVIESVGEVLEYDPPHRLTYATAPHPDTGNPAPRTTVDYLLQPLGEHVVLLTVTHTGLDEQSLRGVSGGWPAILSNLKSLLETGRPLSMPAEVLAAYR